MLKVLVHDLTSLKYFLDNNGGGINSMPALLRMAILCSHLPAGRTVLFRCSQTLLSKVSPKIRHIVHWLLCKYIAFLVSFLAILLFTRSLYCSSW